MDETFRLYGILFGLMVLVVWAIVRKLPKSSTTSNRNTPLEPEVHRGTTNEEK